MANFVYGAIKVANSIWPGKLDFKSEPTGWDFSNLLPKEEFDKVFEEIRKTEKFWYKLRPYIDNVNALQTFIWTNKDVDVYFVTAREETIGKSVLEQTTDWLFAYKLWPNKLRSTVIPVKSGKIKHEIMRAVGIEYSIDDYPETVRLCNEVPGHKAFLLDRPWNGGVELVGYEQTKYNRVFSLSEYLNIIRKPKPPKPEKKYKKKVLKKFSGLANQLKIPSDFTSYNITYKTSGPPIGDVLTPEKLKNFFKQLDKVVEKKKSENLQSDSTTA